MSLRMCILKVELLERERKRMAEMMRAMMVGGAYTAPDENNEPQPMDVEMDIDMDIREPEVTHGSPHISFFHIYRRTLFWLSVNFLTCAMPFWFVEYLT